MCSLFVSYFTSSMFLGGSLTTCQRQRKTALQNSVQGQFIPRCEPDGSFSRVQCEGMMCYCVDKRGIEIRGTRVSLPATANCRVSVTKDPRGKFSFLVQGRRTPLNNF